jgi:prolyl 4-hydroxylase
MDNSEATLRRKADAGDGAAQFELALKLYARESADEALQWLGRSAKAGVVPAFTELGARMVVGTGAPKSPADGLQLLGVAANNGDPLAARYLAILHGSGFAAAQDWTAALDWLRRAAELGDESAAGEIALLEDAAAAPTTEAILDAWLAPPDVELLSESPRIGVVRKFVPAQLCRELIDGAKDCLKPAGTTDARTGRFTLDPARTNRFVQVRVFDYSLPLLLARQQMAQIVGQPTPNFEVMNILSYEPGEEYLPHHDYLDPSSPGFQQELDQRGQRVGTFLVYLNGDYAGGETCFVDIDIKFRGEQGDALFFINAGADGTVDARTRHAGLPPEDRTKWLLSQWIRNAPQPVY